MLTRCSSPPIAPVPRVRIPCSSRSEEHTSELQSLTNLVCRLLLEKKKKNTTILSTLHRRVLLMASTVAWTVTKERLDPSQHGSIDGVHRETASRMRTRKATIAVHN